MVSAAWSRCQQHGHGVGSMVTVSAAWSWCQAACERCVKRTSVIKFQPMRARLRPDTLTHPCVKSACHARVFGWSDIHTHLYVTCRQASSHETCRQAPSLPLSLPLRDMQTSTLARHAHLCKSIHSPLAGPSGEVEGQSERESKRGVNSQETERERHVKS